MKIHFIKLTTAPDEPFLATEVKEERFSAPLHFHPELELTLILEGSGRRFIGDSIKNYYPGDLVLLGENIPHFWCSDTNAHHNRYDLAIVVQFSKSFLGEHFFKITGAHHIEKLIANSTRGLCLNHLKEASLIRKKLIQIVKINSFKQTLVLLEILDTIGKYKPDFLSSAGFKPSLNEIDVNRMNKVYNYVYHHLNQKLNIGHMADLLNMSVSAFCHYFKRINQKTFSQFINEARIGQAKRLLMETDKSIAEVAYKSGYNSLSNFNKQFLIIEKISPKNFRKNYPD